MVGKGIVEINVDEPVVIGQSSLLTAGISWRLLKEVVGVALVVSNLEIPNNLLVLFVSKVLGYPSITVTRMKDISNLVSKVLLLHFLPILF